MILTVCIFSLINTSSMELKIVEACFIFRGPTRKPALATSKARKRWREDLDKNEVELTGQKHNVMSKPQACILQSSTKYYSSLKTGRWFRRCKFKKKKIITAKLPPVCDAVNLKLSLQVARLNPQTGIFQRPNLFTAVNLKLPMQRARLQPQTGIF